MVVIISKVVFMLLDFLIGMYSDNEELKRIKKELSNEMLKQQGRDVEKVVDLGNSMKEQDKELDKEMDNNRKELE